MSWAWSGHVRHAPPEILTELEKSERRHQAMDKLLSEPMPPLTPEQEEELGHLEEAASSVLADVHRTIDLKVGMYFRPGPEPVYWSVAITIGGRLRGVMSLQVGETRSHYTARLADGLQDQWVIEELAAAWPRCPAHGRHPVVAHEQQSQSVWRCPRDGSLVWPIGTIPVLVKEPEVDAGKVRWMRSSYGAIADPGGDVWFHLGMLDQDWPRRRLSPLGHPYPVVEEDDEVGYELDEGAQGNYRRARRVWKLP